MNEYHKIQSLYLRDPANKHRTFLDGQWSKPVFEVLGPARIWQATEKVDGTNIRVGWDGEAVHFGGRTARAQLPTFLYERLTEMFPAEKMLAALGDEGGVTLYGEGYGAKIQKGGEAYGDPNFILFDVEAGGVWFERDKVLDVADALGIHTVPLLWGGELLTLPEAAMRCREGFPSELRDTPPEGVVMRPQRELLDRLGNRVITKIKLRDFAGEP